MAENVVVGIVGTLLAGKGVVVEILKSKGFKHVSVRELIKEELSRQDIPLSRYNMIDMGNRMRESHGLHYWMAMALEKNSDNSPIIIESLRNPAEIEFLRTNSNFFLIGVDAPFELRWQRVLKRNIDSDKKDYETFIQDDARDHGFEQPPQGQQVGLCLEQADYLIYNDKEFERLEESKIYDEVLEIYGKIMDRK